MINDQKFQSLYTSLNPAQREAVDLVEGPVMVMAGPGTGKTQVLTLRIANILRITDTEPANILALTFTESAVAGMRRRLAEIIGSPAYAVTINTFHGFCNDIIKNYPEYFPGIIGSRQITEIDQIAILETLIFKTKLKLLRPFGDPLLYTKTILSSLNNLKREAWEASDFAELINQERERLNSLPDLHHEKGAHRGKMKSQYQKLFKDIDKNEELARLYLAYEEYLRTEKLYDYSDMIMEVLRTISDNQELLQILQEEHQYILLDEHQDTNNAQNRIIELLADFHPNPNLFVVGDDKQAIYRFQGASLDNFLYFQKKFPGAKLIALQDNYRSSAIILKSAESLLAGNKPLNPQADLADEPICLADFDSQMAELDFVVSDLAQKIAAGIPAEKMAVLYRDNKDVLLLARLAEKAGLPIIIESDQDLLSQMDVKKILILLEAVENFGADEPLAAALHLDLWDLPPIEIYRLLRQANQEKQPLIEIISQASITADIYKQLSTWREESKNLDLLSFVERVIRGSGIFETIIASAGARDRFSAIRRLYDEIASLLEAHPETSLADFLKYLDTIRKHKLLLKQNKTTILPGRVRLMTVHRSKGLEFDWVYIIGAYDGHFGGRRNRELLKLLPRVYRLEAGEEEAEVIDPQADERRLFYVALTRARQGVIITYSRLNEAGREQLPSAFVTEINPELIKTISPTIDVTKTYQLLFSPPPKNGQNLKDQDFIREIFLSQGLSVSALNNYLICPWRYFYRNLIRLPEAKVKPQMYGIAIHEALADWLSEGGDKDRSKAGLLASFEKHLKNQPLSKEDYEEVLNRGQESLGGWVDNQKDLFHYPTKTEFKIKGVLLTPEIRLTGNLDRVEFLNEANEVRVTDYKTGRPKSRRAIMGDTQSDDGNYYRQLIFYHLLLDLYQTGKYKMTEGVVDFIEPNEKGEYKREVFVIDREAQEELIELIKKTAQEILTLDFWSERCEDKDCYYCDLRNMIKE